MRALQQLIQQLERVRGRVRLLLLTASGASWLTAVIAVAVAAALTDYLLNLPGWLRLTLLIVGLAVALATAVHRLVSIFRLRPQLTSLALRLERLRPDAAEHLASAVAFSTQPDSQRYHDSPVTRTLTTAATREAAESVSPDRIRELINPAEPLRRLGLLAVAVAIVAGACLADPASASIAFQRWADPLGDASWPRRYEVTSMTEGGVAPNNAPLRLEAVVRKHEGPLDDPRTSVRYRFRYADGSVGPPQRALMTRQRDAEVEGLYQRLIEPTRDAQAITFHFESGDDRTEEQTVDLIEPPTLASLAAEVTPPDYAADLVSPRQEYLLQPPRPVATVDALAGARIRLNVGVNGSLHRPAPDAGTQQIHRWVRRHLPGLLGDASPETLRRMDFAYEPDAPGDTRTNFAVSWRLHRQAELRFTLADEYGNRYEDQRLFRFELRPDRPPHASILEPAGDESVLPSAVVPLRAEAEDDVALQRLDLTARPPGESADALVLASEDKQQPRSRVDAELNLSQFELSPGDVLSVVAIARDNFRLGDRRHDPVESTPRRLRIISEQEMVRQMRTDLAELRQRAVRNRDQQQQLAEAEEADRSTAEQQQSLRQRLENMGRSVEAMQRRAQRNRLEDEAMDQILQDAGGMTESAEQAASRAANRLRRLAQQEEADAQQRQQAREDQEEAARQLDELAQLLDQGRDAYELKQELAELSQQQREVSEQTRQMLPQTLGRSLDELTQQQRQQLEELSQQQGELSEQARELIERMRSTSAALSRQSERPEDQATAEALEQAASTGTQQSLEQEMSQASQRTQQNQLSQAQQNQQAAGQTLQQMLEQVEQAEQLRQQILHRRLLELVESIRKLRDQQQAQLDRLQQAEDLIGLDQPQLQLRRNTQAVADQARSTSDEAAEVADLLDGAAGHQADAVRALRADQPSKPDAADAEREALAQLEAALERAEELAEEAGNQLNNEQRQKLIAAYRKILEQQNALREQTQEHRSAEEDQRNRRWRAQVMETGNQQEELRDRLNELGQEVDQTIVYRSVHSEIDGWATDAAEKLQQAQPDAMVVFNQQMVAESIKALIEALQSDSPDEQFAQGGNQGGGGNGAGQQPPLVPPRAEVKLLKARQELIHRGTRSLAEQGDDGQAGEDRRQMLQQLSRQQQALSEAGQQLLQQLQQRRQQMQQQRQQPPQPPDSPDSESPESGALDSPESP